MSSLDSLIKYFFEENKIKEENKENFENSSENKGYNQNMINRIERKNVEEKSSISFKIDNLINSSNASIYNNNLEEKEKLEKSENIDNEEKDISIEEKDEYVGRDRTYSFNPEKVPGTPILNKEEENKTNEYKLDNDKQETEIGKSNEIFDNIPVFSEIVETKIERNDNNLINNAIDDQITNKANYNRRHSFNIETNNFNDNNDNNEESEDDTYKEEEDFLTKEELRRSKREELNNFYNKKEKKENKVIEIIEKRKIEEDNKLAEIIEERKEEEEEDNEETKEKEKEKEEEEAQKRYLEEQDKRKSLQNMRNEMNIRTSSLRDSVEQKKKKLMEMLNEKKNIMENAKNKEKEKDKRNDALYEKKSTNNSMKYGEKISAKKKQLSSTVFNRLYNIDKKKESEKGKEKEKEKEKQFGRNNKKTVRNNNRNNIKNNIKSNLKNKNNKLNKSQTNIFSTNKKEFNSFIIEENPKDDNNLLNNSQRLNIHFPIISDLKKELNKKVHQKQKTNQNLFDTKEFIQKFLNDSKNVNSSNKFEKFSKPITIEDSENESYSFRPEINQKSKDLCIKKIKKRDNSSPDNNILARSYIENRRLNAPIGDLLYEDATIKKQKLENICINEKINIKKDVNQSLISKGSVSLLLKNYEIKLNNTVEKYAKINEGKLSIANTIQILWEIHILREILKYSNKNIGEIDLYYIKDIVEKIMDKNTKVHREIEEIEFVEQFWIKINPFYQNEKDLIEEEQLKKFLKILFSLNEQSEINKSIGIVNKYLKSIKDPKKENTENKEENNENNINNDDNNDNDNNLNINDEKDNNKIFNSLLRNKEYRRQDIWPISKFIRVFFELKKLLSTYKTSKKEKIMEDIKKEREKELTFQPDFNATSSYFRKRQKKEEDEDFNNTSINSTNPDNNKNKKKHDFNKLYEEFMLKKQMHEKALIILRNNKEKKELKMLTDRPKINKDYKMKNRRKTPEVGCSRNEFLYKLNKDILDTKKQNELKKENEYKQYSFKPTISSNPFLMNKSFAEGEKNQPKGSEEYIKRNRSLIQFKKRESIKEENRITGQNYEKTKKKKVNLPRIKDLEPSTNLLDEKEINKNEEKSIKNEDNNSVSQSDNDIYFTIQVKTIKGRVKPLKIYFNNNPIETVNNFCDGNNIQKHTRDKIIKKIKELQEAYKALGIKEDKKE